MSALPAFEQPEPDAGRSGSLATQFAFADFAYQPIISTSTLRVHGFEALARLPEGHARHSRSARPRRRWRSAPLAAMTAELRPELGGIAKLLC